MNQVMGNGGDKPLVLTEPQKAKVKAVASPNAEQRCVGRPAIDNRLGLGPVPRANSLGLLRVSGHRQPVRDGQQCGQVLTVIGKGIDP
jgi:hypothetical protein